VSPARRAEVIVVGGGPAGSALAWRLASRGLRPLVLERARFPREKVCGDYVDPRGLHILEAMGCLGRLERSHPPAISHTTTFVEWRPRYSGPIAFYGHGGPLPPHGYTIPREELDAAMVDAAVAAGAILHDETAVIDVEAGAGGVEVTAEHGGDTVRYSARVIVGADGANSVVARSQGAAIADPRRTVLAQRAYAVTAGASAWPGETEVYFNENLFPGYGWVFPATGGRVNLGIGLLDETRRRLRVNIPALFGQFVDGLRRCHPSCTGLELSSKPIGGIVKTYGAAGPNHFAGGLLIGDAGGFVNPMTGDGITPGMESALLAARTVESALEAGDVSAGRLSSYERAFRAYFDPSMVFFDLCAAMLRNRHLARPWLKALARGCELAQADTGFARTTGSFFGGLEVHSSEIIARVWLAVAEDLLLAWPRAFSGSGTRPRATAPGDVVEWQMAMARSAVTDPLWHLRWSIDVQQLFSRVMSTAARAPGDPRAGGLLHGR